MLTYLFLKRFLDFFAFHRKFLKNPKQRHFLTTSSLFFGWGGRGDLFSFFLLLFVCLFLFICVFFGSCFCLLLLVVSFVPFCCKETKTIFCTFTGFRSFFSQSPCLRMFYFLVCFFFLILLLFLCFVFRIFSLFSFQAFIFFISFSYLNLSFLKSCSSSASCFIAFLYFNLLLSKSFPQTSPLSNSYCFHVLVVLLFLSCLASCFVVLRDTLFGLQQNTLSIPSQGL